MHQFQYKSCTVAECDARPVRGKPYCHAHLKDQGKPKVISRDQRAKMRSDCCNAAVTEGEQHDYGKQYCDKCKHACCWHPEGSAKK